MAKSNYDSYDLVEDLSELTVEGYQYVIVNRDNTTIDQLKNKHGVDNVREPIEMGLDQFLPGDKALIKIQSYRQHGTVSNQWEVVLIINNKNLKKWSWDDVRKPLEDLHYIYQKSERPSNKDKTAKLKGVYFANCWLKQAGIWEDFIFAKCTIDHLHYNDTNMPEMVTLFYKCKMGVVTQDGDKEIVINRNEIDNLIAESTRIKLHDVKLKLYFHKKLGEINYMHFSNVRINYDAKALKKIKQDNYQGYENTCRYLLELRGLKSERIRIEKYVHYFSSRVDRAMREVWVKRLPAIIKKLVSIPGLKQVFLSCGTRRFLFWFHEGYTNPWKTLAIAIITVVANYYILYNGVQDGGNLSGTGLTPADSLSTIFYPVDLFKEVVFKDFVLDPNLWSWEKICLFVFELFFLYSFFCFSATLKKLFGFKLQK